MSFPICSLGEQLTVTEFKPYLSRHLSCNRNSEQFKFTIMDL